ncbi:MAG: hypothetical protein AAF799_10585 [Myxococcota bacterium]
MSRDKTNEAVRFFLDEWVTAEQRQALVDSPHTLYQWGVYSKYTGGPIDAVAGRRLTPNFHLRLSRDPIPRQAGFPVTADATLGVDPVSTPLFFVRRVADPIQDSEEEIRQTLLSGLFHGSLAAQRSEEWAAQAAAAIHGAASSGTLSQNVFTHTAVPDGLEVLGDRDQFFELMTNWFTFTWEGNYYSRWESGSTGTSADELTSDYLDRNLLEVQLRDDCAYARIVAPQHWFLGTARPATVAFREVYLQFSFEGDRIDHVEIVHSVGVDVPGNTADYYDISFFYAEDGFVPPHTRELTPVTTYVSGFVVGHASPRWDHHRRDEDPQQLNLALSRRRADHVSAMLQELINAAGHGDTLVCDLVNACYIPPVGSDGDETSGMALVALGDQVTRVEAGGDENADAESMRRAEISVVVTHQVATQQTLDYTETVRYRIPEECEPNETRRWAVAISVSGGAGHAGIGGAFALGKLKNRLTGQTAQGAFTGGGPGIGLASPGADPGWGDWTNFTTAYGCTFEDFDVTDAVLISASVGIAIFGVSVAWLGFPTLGVSPMWIGDFNMGTFGADAGVNWGAWNVIGDPPGPRCSPERWESREESRQIQSPFRLEGTEQLTLTVTFDTGEDELAGDQQEALQNFAQQIVAAYQQGQALAQ